MDIYDETIEPFKDLWDDKMARQSAKIIITNAIGNTTELSVKETQAILDELDRLLLTSEEDEKKQKNPGL